MNVLQLHRAGSLPANQPPEQNFTGDVSISDYLARAAPSRLVSATVSFAPGARTPWKVNPLGQTLFVTSGIGWAQGEGGEIIEIRAGDVIWCPPGQRHWDGATPTQAMTYIAVHEAQDGRAVEFGEKVTDEEYGQGLPHAEGPPAD